MTYAIRVQKSPEYSQNDNLNPLVKKFDGPKENPYLLVKEFKTPEEFRSVAVLCDSKRRIDWLESLIIPVRTDNLSNFCKDFFLPGLFNVALKVDDLVTKILLCIFMPIYDIITLPIRLITVIPRCIYNTLHPKEAHPFYQYLISNGVTAENLNAGHVYLEAKWTEKDGYLTTRKETFNFMHLPVAQEEHRLFWELWVPLCFLRC